MKEKGKTKSEKVRMSLLFTFSLLLFTSAANAAGQGPVEGYYTVDETLVTRFSVDDVRAVNRNPTADEIAAADAAIDAAGGSGPKLEMPIKSALGVAMLVVYLPFILDMLMYTKDDAIVDPVMKIIN